jgi:hypothetical protein
MISPGAAAASTLSPEQLNEMADKWHTWYEQYGDDFFHPVEMSEVDKAPPATGQLQADADAIGLGED